MLAKWLPVVIEWEDAHSNGEQLKDQEAENYEPVLRKTIGFVIRDLPAALIIAGTDDRRSSHILGGTTTADKTVIPRGMIRGVTELRAVRSPKSGQKPAKRKP